MSGRDRLRRAIRRGLKLVMDVRGDDLQESARRGRYTERTGTRSPRTSPPSLAEEPLVLTTRSQAPQGGRRAVSSDRGADLVLPPGRVLMTP